MEIYGRTQERSRVKTIREKLSPAPGINPGFRRKQNLDINSLVDMTEKVEVGLIRSFILFIPPAWAEDGNIVRLGSTLFGRIQIFAAIFCPSVTCSNVPAISFHNILINLQYNFQNLNDKQFSQMVLSTRN